MLISYLGFSLFDVYGHVYHYYDFHLLSVVQHRLKVYGQGCEFNTLPLGALMYFTRMTVLLDRWQCGLRAKALVRT